MGSDQLFEALREAVLARGLDDVAVRRVGCLGLCAAGPLVEVPEQGRLFERAHPGEPERTEELVSSLAGETLGGRSVATDPFFSHQVKVVLERCGTVDPERLEDYVATGGYEALAKALTTMAPEDVIAEVVRSGLRGRGGAGYPTGLKWRTVAKADGAEGKYVVCNADEGDPGAFMDRSVLESCPQQVLEGMAIAGYAVGAKRGYVYVRAEYPLAVKRLSSAIRQAERDGHLGSEIAGTRFDFQVEVRIGAGAFVCGEETALIASIQGGRGTPRPRPPYPAASGLWGCPTLINNVETFANIPAVITPGRRVAERYRDRTLQGDEGLRPDRGGHQHGADRGADGPDPAPDRVRDRGWPGRRPPVQGGPDGRAVRRLHPGKPVGHAGRLRDAGRGGVDNGLGRHDRHGRPDVHGRRGQVLHGLLPGGILRQVPPVPGGHRGDVPVARPDNHGPGHSGLTWPNWKIWRQW